MLLIEPKPINHKSPIFWAVAFLLGVVLSGLIIGFLAPIETVYVCSDPKARVRSDGILDCRAWKPMKKAIFARMPEPE